MFLRSCLLIILFASTAVIADSKRVIVYELGQHMWQIKRGDTLSEIIATIAPGNVNHHALMQQIVKNNPQAFINNNPDQLIAGQKLWFDRAFPRTQSANNPQQYTIEKFSWGSIKKLKE